MSAATEQFERFLAPGRTVYLPGASGESLALAGLIKAAPDAWSGVRFVSCLVPGMNETVDYGTIAPGCSITTFMLPARLRESYSAGAVTLVPRTYSGIAHLLSASRCDVAIAHVAPPDAQGSCSLGIASDFTPLLWQNAAARILIVNPAMPRMPRGPALAMDDAHALVTLDGPLVATASVMPSGEADAIAAHVAALIPDGAHIQTGIGGVPDALGKHLRDHRGLVLRSGMANDWLRDLADCGALAPRGGHLAGIAYGTPDFYAYLARTDLVEFATTAQTHDLPTLAQVPRLHSINSALEVDLFGQVNVEWQGARLSGGVGGGPDFMRAAAYSPGGRAIIAMPATAKRGSVSRVVLRLDSPTTSIARSDIDVVVTEYGAAELRDKGIDQRADALVEIAAPPFRDELADGWARLRRTFTGSGLPVPADRGGSMP